MSKVLKLSTLTNEEAQAFANYILANDPTASYTFHKVINGETYTVSGVTLEMVIDPKRHELAEAMDDFKMSVWQHI